MSSDDPGARATVTSVAVDDGVLVRIDGELDVSSVPGVGKALSALTGELAPSSLVVFDISGVGFLAAAGVHMLRGALASCAAHGVRPSLVVDSGCIAQQLLRMVTLGDNVRMVTSVEDALRAGPASGQ